MRVDFLGQLANSRLFRTLLEHVIWRFDFLGRNPFWLTGKTILSLNRDKAIGSVLMPKKEAYFNEQIFNNNYNKNLVRKYWPIMFVGRQKLIKQCQMLSMLPLFEILSSNSFQLLNFFINNHSGGFRTNINLNYGMRLYIKSCLTVAP